MTVFDFGKKIEFFTPIPDVPTEWFSTKSLNFDQDDWNTKKEIRIRSASPGESYITVVVPTTNNFSDDSFTPIRLQVLEPGVPLTTQISIDDASAIEGSSVDFTVSVSPPFAQQISLNYATADGAADSSDYTAASGTLTIPANSKSGSISVQTTADTTFEPDETFTVTISGAPSDTEIKKATATGTIANDDPRPISHISIADASADEGDDIDFDVTVSPPWYQPMTLNYTIADVTTSSSTDDFPGGARSGALSLAADQASATLSIPTEHDFGEETDETFTLTLSGAPNGTNLQRAMATGTIVNNDTATRLSIADASVTEGGTMTFVVTLEPPSHKTLHFLYRTMQDTATVGDDYRPGYEESDTSFIGANAQAGETRHLIEVPTVDDAIVEEIETFSIEINVSEPPEFARVIRGRATGSIKDNDHVSVVPGTLDIGEGSSSEASYTVVLVQQPSQGATVSISESPQGKLTLDKTQLTFSTSTWNQPQTVTVTGIPDSTFDSHDVVLSHTLQVGSVTRDGAETRVRVHDPIQVAGRFVGASNALTPGFSVTEENSFTYSFRLADQPQFTMNLRPKIASGDPVLTFDPEVLTFTPQNYSQGQQVTVTAIVDGDLDDHTVYVSHSADELPNAEITGKATVQVIDDKLIRNMTFTPSSIHIAEAGSGTYDISLKNDPGGAATVTITPSNDAVLSVSTTTLTFDSTDYNMPQTVKVTGIPDDTRSYYPQVFNISHTLQVGSDPVEAGPSLKVNVHDRLINNSGQFSTSSEDRTFRAKLDEGGESVTVGYRITNPVRFPVTFRPKIYHGANAIRFSPETLAFTPDNYNTFQEITISAVSDFGHNDHDDIRFTFKIDELPNDGSYSRGIISVKDDDKSYIEVDPDTAINLVEGGKPVILRIRLTLDPRSVVDAHVIVHSPTDVDLPRKVKVTPGGGSFTPGTDGNWNDWAEFTVEPIEDEDFDDEAWELIASFTHDHNAQRKYIPVNVEDPPIPAVRVSRDSMTITEGAAGQSYTVRLATDPGATSTVTVGVASDSANINVSTSTLTFVGGDDGDWSTAQSVQVTSSQDGDSDYERATISHTVTGYEGVTTAPSVRVGVNDNEAAKDMILTPSSFSIYEGGSTSTINVRLTTDPGHMVKVSVDPYAIDGASLDTHNFTLTPGPDGNWEAGYDLLFTTDDNDNNETHDNIKLGIYAWGYPTELRDIRKSVNIVILDDDAVAGLTLTNDPFAINEGAKGWHYDVLLNTDPGQEVTVSIANPDSAKLDISASELTFDSENWRKPQRVAVRALEDADTDHEDLTIVHTITGYTGVTSVSKDVLVYDNDVSPAVIVSQRELSLTEGGAAGSFDVSLATDPRKPVTIDIVNPDKRAVNIASSTLTFTPGPNGDWREPQTVEVTPLDDNDGQYEQFTLTLDVKGYGGAGTAPSIRVMVEDDETPSTLPVVTPSTSTLELTEGVAGTYTIQLASDPGGQVSISLANPDPGAVSLSHASVEFDSGTWNSPRTIKVTPVDDANAADESVEIEHRAYNKNVGSITVTVEDDDGTPGVIMSPPRMYMDERYGSNLLEPGFNPDRSLAYIAERANNMSLCFQLATDPEGDVTIHLPVNTNFAYWKPTGHNNWVLQHSYSVAFTGGKNGNWNQRKCVGIEPHADHIHEDKSGTTTFKVTGYQGVESASLNWEIWDNYWARITSSKSAIDVNEGGDSTTYNLQIWYRPSKEMTITVNNPDESSIQISPKQFTIDPSNFRILSYGKCGPGAYIYCRQVKVTPLRDSNFSDEEVVLTHSITGYFDITEGPEVTVNVLEPFRNGIHVFPTKLILLENTISDNVYLRLGADPGDSSTVVTLTPSVDSAYSSKVSFSPATLTFTGGESGDWDTYKTIAVSSNADSDIDDESFTITFTVSGTSASLSAPEVSIEIQDIGN